MLLKHLFSRQWRRLLLATCLLTVPARTVCAQEIALASDLAIHPSVIDLRPISDDDSPPKPSSARVTANDASAQIAPSRIAASDAPAPAGPHPVATDASALAGPMRITYSDSGPAPITTTDATVQPAPIRIAAVDTSTLAGPVRVAYTDTASGTTGSVPDPATVPDPTAGSELASNASARASDSASAPVDSAPATPSQNATVNLINLMVKRNLITKEDAAGLIRQAQQEADVAKAQAATTRSTAERALAAQSAQPALAPAVAPSTSSDDEVRIAYVPDVVKKQITEQVTQNVMEQTREEHLADTVAASQVPDWVKRFHVMGDVRIRYEGDQYPSGNAIGNFTNFNAINTSASGFNVNSASPLLPQYNVDQDRNRFRLRTRIGAGIDLGENFTSGIRIASGSDDSPVTENQTLGGANGGQGGNFGKYQIWLDRAFLRYDYGGSPDKDVSLTIGRFDNPFFNTSMMWADDLGFDGAVAKASYQVVPGLTPFLTAGGFPVFNTDLNFSTNQSAKFQSEDKYLIAAQGGTRWTINKDFSVIGAAGYYDFENIAGKVSDPILNAGLNAGNTDDSRPAFAQNGNTYIALRDYEDPTAIPGVTVENQYYGLASDFQVLALTGQLDCACFDPFHMSITGEFIKNLAFDRNAIINAGPSSNSGPQNNTLSTNPNSFDGGDTGYLVHLDLGKVTLEHLWDWNLKLSYRYVETDATVDGFTDSDFGGSLTGTNLKGYTIGGNLALSSRVWAGLRWMSADNVSGPTFRNDLIQFDLNAKF